MKTVLALLMATALGARAEEARPAPHAHGSDSGLVLLDIFLEEGLATEPPEWVRPPSPFDPRGQGTWPTPPPPNSAATRTNLRCERARDPRHRV